MRIHWLFSLISPSVYSVFLEAYYILERKLLSIIYKNKRLYPQTSCNLFYYRSLAQFLTTHLRKIIYWS